MVLGVAWGEFFPLRRCPKTNPTAGHWAGRKHEPNGGAGCAQICEFSFVKQLLAKASNTWWRREIGASLFCR